MGLQMKIGKHGNFLQMQMVDSRMKERYMKIMKMGLAQIITVGQSSLGSHKLFEPEPLPLFPGVTSKVTEFAHRKKSYLERILSYFIPLD